MFSCEMRRARVDDGFADRLLSGAVPPDAAPGYAEVAELFDSVRPQPAAGELPREAATVAGMRAAVLRHPVPLSSPNRKSRRRRPLAAKVVVVAAAAIMGAGSAAAATGNLPDAAQSTVSDLLSKVGVSVPKPDRGNNGGPDSAREMGAHPTASSSNRRLGNSHADSGLSTAEGASAGHPSINATVFATATTYPTPASPTSRDRATSPSTGPPAKSASQGRADPPTSDPPATPGSRGQRRSPDTRTVPSTSGGGAVTHPPGARR